MTPVRIPSRMEQHRMTRQAWTLAEIDTMVDQYVATALWSTTGDDGRNLDDDYGVDDIDPATLATMREEMIAFYAANRRLLCAHTDPGQAGHDFWLTRNGHGTGFWDRGYSGAGDVDTGKVSITGEAAASIARHVATLVKPGRNWVEVQALRECAHGCKLHARKQGAVTQYRLFHSATYGCALGRQTETRQVPVTVAKGDRRRARFDAAMTRLSADAKVWGETNLIVGDDGKIHA